MTDGFKQACLVKPVHPTKCLPLFRLDRLPRAILSNQPRPVKPVDGLSERVVVSVSGAAQYGTPKPKGDWHRVTDTGLSGTRADSVLL